MVHRSVIEARLSQLGVHLSRWYQAELAELQHVLHEDEKIIAAVPGRYFAGYALLVATNHRVLLIDKRTFFLTLEDIRYDMISEIDFGSRMFDATLQIFTLNKQHRFTSSKYRKQLRSMTVFIQQQLTLRRQQENGSFNLQARMGNSPGSSMPLREVYPTKAVTPASPSAPMRYAPPTRNFKKVGSVTVKAARRFHSPHVHLPHPHLPHTELNLNAPGDIIYQRPTT